MNDKPYILLLSLILIINGSKCMDTEEYMRKVAEANKIIENINAEWIAFGDNNEAVARLKGFLTDKTPDENKHKNALFKAVKDGDHSKLIVLLADNGDPNVYDEKNRPLIMQALFKKDLISLAIILSAPNVNPSLARKRYKDRGFTYNTPLNYSIANTQLAATIMLCEAGVNIKLHESFRPYYEHYNACSQYAWEFEKY